MRPGSVAALALIVGWLALAGLASHSLQPSPGPSSTSAGGRAAEHNSAHGARNPREQTRDANADTPSTAALTALRDGQRVDINTATRADLELLPGVGPKLAERIEQARKDRGAFASIEQVQEVKGIGPAKLARIAKVACAGQGCAQRSSASTSDTMLTK